MPPYSVTAIERLLLKAEALAWCRPRWSWALAHTAYSAAQGLAQRVKKPSSDYLLASSTLTLGITLNAMGQFAQALPLLSKADKQLQAHRGQAVRAKSEIALACTYLGQFEAAQSAIAEARQIGLSDSAINAYCNRAEGLLYFTKTNYDQASTLLRQAAEAFLAAGWEGEAALTWCHLAEVMRYIDLQEALDLLKRASCETARGEKAREGGDSRCRCRLRRKRSLAHSPTRPLAVSQDAPLSCPAGAPFHLARCKHILALIYHEQNRYAESLELYREAQAAFATEGIDFLTAHCLLGQGYAHYRLNQYQPALSAYTLARESFEAQQLSGYVAICDLNIAIVYYDTNRYREALALYGRVAEEALSEERVLRVARCYTNMGLCYEKLARYDQALMLHQRARHAFLEAGSQIYAARCQENLAGTCRNLGLYEQAITHYQQAYLVFAEAKLTIKMAFCKMQLADLYLLLEQPEEAKACLEGAHRVYAEAGMNVYQALCYRLLAQVALACGEYEQVATLLTQAREVFSSQEMMIETALCDLTEGEANLALGQLVSSQKVGATRPLGFPKPQGSFPRNIEQVRQLELAKQCFQRAQAVLEPGFPDLAWRAEEGLAHCALREKDKEAALKHYIQATSFVSQTRDHLPTEQLSSTFFARRQYLFQAAINLALELDSVAQALALVENSKSRTLLTQHQSPPWKRDYTDDPYLASLVEREVTLRLKIEKWRTQLTSWDEKLLSDMDAEPQATLLKELASLSQTYEEVVDQLRLSAATERMPASPFNIKAFREAASRHLSGKWLVLTYFLAGDQLLIFSLNAHSLQVHTKQLTPFDHHILSQCTNTSRERREMIYGGTIRGSLAPGNPGLAYRQKLGQLLLPPNVVSSQKVGVTPTRPLGFLKPQGSFPRNIEQVPNVLDSKWDMLILIPHGILHHLPLHALFTGDALLLEQVPVLYAPSLQLMQLLLRNQTIYAHCGALICGVEEFGKRADPLPHAKREVELVSETLSSVGKQVTLLYGADATVSKLKEMSLTSELASFEFIHFNTHAVAEADAPTLSRILLADEALTVGDILELKLAARLVTLSCCHAATGKIRVGDEMMSLARAFFYAGAQAVVASLWAVEDEATVMLMQHFYQQLQRGATIPQALRQAQTAMQSAGYNAYQWGSFIAIGLP